MAQRMTVIEISTAIPGGISELLAEYRACWRVVPESRRGSIAAAIELFANTAWLEPQKSEKLSC